MTSTTVRCGNCNYWLGESPVAVIRVEFVAKSEEVRVAHPRDLRLCKQCGKVNVFIPFEDLASRRSPVLSSPATVG